MAPGGLPYTARNAVITGVSSGIGYATAEALSAQGFHVFGSVRKPSDAARLEAALGPGRFTPLLLDVTDTAAVERAAAVVRAALRGRTLSALVNNAGMTIGLNPLELVPLERLRRQLEVNLVAIVGVTQAFLPLLGTDPTLEGPPGRIINVSSIYGGYGLPFQGGYCASKAALNMISESLRRELRPFGIAVIILRVGPVASAIWHGAVEEGGNYAGSAYGAALRTTGAFSMAEFAKPRWFLPPAAVAARVCKVLAAARPAARYTVSPNLLENVLLPAVLPAALLDREICARMGLLRPIVRRAGDEAAPFLATGGEQTPQGRVELPQAIASTSCQKI